MSKPITDPFYDRLKTRIRELGGIHNAHVHLDRAGTLDETYFEGVKLNVLDNSHVSLHRKHQLIANLHLGRAYHPEEFSARVNAYLDVMVAAGTARADTMVDVTADGLGLSALEAMRAASLARTDIDLKIAAYSPLGYRDDEPERWDLFLEGAGEADFLGCLPEADDIAHDGHIGFEEHCRRMLLLAQDVKKMIHVHVDQRNEPGETGTEILIESIRRYGAPSSRSGEPMVWAVHMISPSTYEEDRFERLVAGLLEYNIGVISCPSAAIGMRQLRPLRTPTYNSIPRVLEMLSAGVHVRLGSDNIADMLSPSTTANLIDEVFVLSAALRFYNPDILAKLAAGARITPAEAGFIAGHLRSNAEEIERALKRPPNSH